MADIPEHLLKRSKDRRKALGLAVDDDASATDSGDAAPSAAASAPAPGNSPAPGAPIGKAPAVAPHQVGPPQVAPLKNRVPWYVVPVLLFLPIWAIMYYGSLTHPVKEVSFASPLEEGKALFAATGAGGCANCHGANGEGGVGPALAKGEVLKTFPDKYTDATGKALIGFDEQVKWVTGGSGKYGPPGSVYGEPSRNHTITGGMPGFGAAAGGSLTEDQIKAIVTFEREGLK